nr:response regulator transcription factor [uncultured Gemmiger sp.]
MPRIQDVKILLVDDNPDLLELLRQTLQGAGYTHLDTAQTCAQARETFARERPGLVVLDINLPDGDGFSLFRELNGDGEIPVLFLSARDADADRLFGLGLGADDYLTKPFLTQELLLRIQLILRRVWGSRGQPPATDELNLAACRVELGDASVRRADGTALTLTGTERTILQKLADNRGHIVTYDAVCEAVWGQGYYGYENSLNVHIRHLREKIEADPSRPQSLVTARGLGYKLLTEE